tara:strand:- start:4211 stop:5383 length:1173 start_codon:yes stop_codon:yes gene_type:complete
MSKILILGGDGYIGWPLSLYLSKNNHKVHIVDNFVKKFWESQQGVEPLKSPLSLKKRLDIWNEISGFHIGYSVGDIAENPKFIYRILDEFKPQAIVHLAEQPSAPYSMIGRSQAFETQRNNVLGTLNLMFAIQKSCPSVHLIKLGTMGEYGQPNIDIEEGWLNIEHNGRKDKLLFPKSPGSFYHASKVHDSTNLEFACRTWGFKVTDLNQGVVYGVQTNETKLSEKLNTSFHYDDIFGTVINRFMTQAVVEHPITIYGNGTQTRAYIYLEDALKCIEIAINNPAKDGEFRVFNQFTEQFDLNSLAKIISAASREIGMETIIENIKNPRVEKENHFFNAIANNLPSLGLNPTKLTKSLLSEMMFFIQKYKNDIDRSKLIPKVKWNRDLNAN